MAGSKKGCRFLAGIGVADTVTTPIRTAENGVDEAGRFGGILLGQIHRLVNCRRDRNPVKEKHLVQSETQQQDNCSLQFCRRSLGKPADNMVKSPLFAQCPVDQLRIKSPVRPAQPPLL